MSGPPTPPPAPREGSAHPTGLPPALTAAPPWILGHRGAPLDAPENTLASLHHALEAGLDGVEYDLQGSLEDEPVLLHDDTLERTAGDRRPVEDVPLAELAALEVGGWFQKRFVGEPLPLFADALSLGHTAVGEPALHMVELKRADLVGRVVEILRETAPTLPVRIASFHREVCLAARDAGMPSMLLSVRYRADDGEWLRRERIEAYGLGPGGWRGAPTKGLEKIERWGWSVDRPDHLLEACRRPFFGFNTNEPRRALGARALVRLAPDDDGPWPIETPELEVFPERDAEGRGPFAGRWQVAAALRNPFGVAVRVEPFLEVRRGAFEATSLPESIELAPGERREFSFELAGGSFSPGLDPLLAARFVIPEGPGRPAAALTLDAPLVRIRRAVLRATSTRLLCLAEEPGGAVASLGLRRRGSELVLELEHTGGLNEPHVAAVLDGEFRIGTRGLRMRLPEGFDDRSEGTPFTAGVMGLDPVRSTPTWRRWAGGLPADMLSGSPGRLYPGSRA